jgi:hypothetical protein
LVASRALAKPQISEKRRRFTYGQICSALKCMDRMRGVGTGTARPTVHHRITCANLVATDDDFIHQYL